MNIDLSGENVLITGGTRGIGRVIATTLAQSGARVGAIYRTDNASAERTLGELQRHGEGHFILQADISVESESVMATTEAGLRFGGAIDHLILDAAAGAGGRMVDMTTEEWKRPFEVNVHGAFFVVRSITPMLRTGGSVVFLSSGAGHDPMEGLSAYGASKAAVNHLSGVLAQELGPMGIRVNVVSPGHTHKDDSDPNSDPSQYTDGQRSVVETTALRRLGTAQDVANVVLFYVSDLSRFVTGQWTRVNGGRI